MEPDISMALNSEINKMHNKERFKLKPKHPFPKPQMQEKEKKKFPSNEIQEAVQTLLQNSLNSQKGIDSAPVINALPFNLHAASQESISPAIAAAQISELFKEMVGAMTHSMETGIQETVLTLDAPQFSKSLFYGAKITITEYSTAPKIYNIQFSASPEAVKVFQVSAAELLAAFKNGKFDFEVNRIDTELASSDLFQKEKGIPPIEKDKGHK
jgi:hypothetical protein